MEIEHFSHEHVLSLSEKKREDKVLCQACNEYCSEGLIYSCRDLCGFSLHESCAKLPQELHNPFLHPHPLSLQLPNPNYGHVYCFGCARYLYRGFTFRCDKCSVNLDVKCAFIRPAIEEEAEEEEGEEAVVVDTHFSHRQHPLLLFEKVPAHRFICHVCGEYCSDPMSYGCLPCRFFLHPSCFKLPQEILHPFHPYHPLTLKRPIKGKGSRRCNACGHFIQDDYNKFAYVCECKINCRFCLHLECASVIMPAITYEGHDHLLQFNHNIRKTDQFYKVNCSACHSICESYGFSCLYCDFNLHHTCGPLPSTIQHKSHIHPLILTTSPLEDEEDCEPDEFYCDACEEQRVDPFLPIYYCEECHFVAEISCVISEVVLSLNGEYGEVELRNPLGQFGKVVTKDAAKEMMQNKDKKQLEPTLTWGNYLGTLSEDEKKEKNFLTDRIKEIITAEKIEAYDHEEIIMFSDKAYTQFMKFLNHSGFSKDKFRYPWDLSDHENQEVVVNVGDYMTTRKLAPFLNHLLSNHGDIGAQSTLSPKFKSLYVCMLCKCIDHMRNTMVVDITHDILLDWWTCLKILQLEGFQIDFAFDHLKRVTHAHFGLYVEKEVDYVFDQFEKWTRKVERIKSAKSSFIIEECRREALVLKKGKAVTFRLL